MSIVALPKPPRRPPRPPRRIARRVRPYPYRRTSMGALRREASRLWSLRIRERDGRCMVPGCGKRTGLDGGHILGKGAFPHMRYELENGCALCREHHRHYTRRPVEWRCVVVELIGDEAWARLMDQARTVVRVDVAAVVDRLGRAS